MAEEAAGATAGVSSTAATEARAAASDCVTGDPAWGAGDGTGRAAAAAGGATGAFSTGAGTTGMGPESAASSAARAAATEWSVACAGAWPAAGPVLGCGTAARRGTAACGFVNGDHVTPSNQRSIPAV